MTSIAQRGSLLAILWLMTSAGCALESDQSSNPDSGDENVSTPSEGSAATADASAGSDDATALGGTTDSAGGTTGSGDVGVGPGRDGSSSDGSSRSDAGQPADGATDGGSGGVIGGTTGTRAIPAGYPAATAENAAMCKTVPMSRGFCPGGGAGPVCLQCLFGGTTFGTSETTPTQEGTMLAGNYVVTVKLGGAVAGQTYVSAESRRGLLSLTTTRAVETRDYAFVVNVRAMEGQPRHSGGPSGYPGLNLFFSGPMAAPPQVAGIGYALASAATKPVMVYMAGDSTVCDQYDSGYGGWGQMLPQHFAPPVGIANYANSGASSNFAFWNDIKSHWTAGDWVIIQFGHNDKGIADSTVQANLERMAGDALAANVTPIIVSPPARSQFSGSTVSSQSGLHAAAAKAAAAAKKVAYIDLTALSTAWYNGFGSQGEALKYHALGSDVTHTNLAGADKLAALVAAEIRKQNLGLAKYLRD